MGGICGSFEDMKLCMIGARGHWAYVFESIGEVPHVELAAVSPGAGDDLAALLTLARENGFSPAVEPDWRNMLARYQPDLVVVDSAFDLHAEMCVAALQQDISVFCEKPVALTLDDLTRVEKALAGSRGKLISMVGLRYQPDFQYALSLVQSGRIGKVKMVQAQKSYRFGVRPDFYRSRAAFGGLIPWVGSHALDWVMAYSGSSFQRIYGTHSREDNFGYGELEASAQMLGVMTNGVQFQACCDYYRPDGAVGHGDDRVRIVGTSGILEVRSGRVHCMDAGGEGDLPVPEPERKLFSDFACSLAGGRPCMVSGQETLELTRACLLARESADSGQVIEFKNYR